MPPPGETWHSRSDHKRGAAHLVEQLSISLDKAKVALAECCTDGSAHAALALSLFQQAISKLDETRYMVRRSLDDAKRSERSSPAPHHLRKSHQDQADPQFDSKAPQNDASSVNEAHPPVRTEYFLRDRAARKDENSSSTGGLGAPARRPGDRSIADSVSPDRQSETISAQAVGRPSSAASTGPARSRRDASPFAFSTRPFDTAARPASLPFLGITKTLSPQPIDADLKDRAPSARSQSVRSEPAADEELQTARNSRGSMARPHRTPPKDSERDRPRSSSRVRHSSPSSETSLSGEDEIPPDPKSRTRSTSLRRKAPDESQCDLSQVVPSQRLWTREPAAPPTRPAFDLASAPPQSDDEEEDVEHTELATLHRAPASLRGERVTAAIVAAASSLSAPVRLDLLRSLALVSQEYRQMAQAELFRDVRLTKSRQLDLLVPILENNATLASAVKALSLRRVGPGRRSRLEFLDQVRRLLAPLHSLESLDEDLSIPDWDIVDYKENDYILSPTSRCRLKAFKSASAWWEISALHALLTDQRELESVVIGGAVVDREWAATNSMMLASPAKKLKRLEVAQVLHEDTLLVLLTATGGREGSLGELDLGFQSIDEETPRASIVAAFRSAGQGLRQLTLHAPSQVSGGDLAGFLDEIVAELPQLESIEWSEHSTSAARIPLASPRFLEHLPTNLRRLQAHSLVSLSTSKVLAMLEEPEKVPSLAELEIEWATGKETNADASRGTASATLPALRTLLPSSV
ncbi:hypothetical protein RHOSPDRAFT_32805 [Rhodotorula sp. JG-1b]|nr:hypothetical protein RHOSPDRAFT_32805 [Rhodotorula sp. JG-1b]